MERLTKPSISLVKPDKGVPVCPGKGAQAPYSPRAPASGGPIKKAQVPSSLGNLASGNSIKEPPPALGSPLLGSSTKESPPDERSLFAAEMQTPEWIFKIQEHLYNQDLPKDDSKAERIARQAKMYILIYGDLYRRRENVVKLKCISWEEGREGSVEAMLHQAPWWVRPSVKDFIGRRPCKMLQNWSRAVMPANSM